MSGSRSLKERWNSRKRTYIVHSGVRNNATHTALHDEEDSITPVSRRVARSIITLCCLAVPIVPMAITFAVFLRKLLVNSPNLQKTNLRVAAAMFTIIAIISIVSLLSAGVVLMEVGSIGVNVKKFNNRGNAVLGKDSFANRIKFNKNIALSMLVTHFSLLFCAIAIIVSAVKNHKNPDNTNALKSVVAFSAIAVIMVVAFMVSIIVMCAGHSCPAVSCYADYESINNGDHYDIPDNVLSTNDTLTMFEWLLDPGFIDSTSVLKDVLMA